jgi:hypothetical protein
MGTSNTSVCPSWPCKFSWGAAEFSTLQEYDKSLKQADSFLYEMKEKHKKSRTKCGSSGKETENL